MLETALPSVGRAIGGQIAATVRDAGPAPKSLPPCETAAAATVQEAIEDIRGRRNVDQLFAALQPQDAAEIAAALLRGEWPVALASRITDPPSANGSSGSSTAVPPPRSTPSPSRTGSRLPLSVASSRNSASTPARRWRTSKEFATRPTLTLKETLWAQPGQELEDIEILGAYARAIPLIGREAELRRVKEWLALPSRVSVAVLVGSAGRGKTRLALEACIDALSMKRWPVSGWYSRPPSPRTASVMRKFLTSRWYRQVGWNCIISMLETRQPARQAIAIPSPVAPRGAGAELVHPPCAACGEHRRPRGIGHHLAAARYRAHRRPRPGPNPNTAPRCAR